MQILPNRVELRVRLLRRRVRFQPPNHSQEIDRVARVAAGVGLGLQGNDDVTIHVWQRETARQNAHNFAGLAVQVHRLAHDIRVFCVTARPETVTDHDDSRRSVPIILRDQWSAEERAQAKNGKGVGRHSHTLDALCFPRIG